MSEGRPPSFGLFEANSDLDEAKANCAFVNPNEHDRLEFFYDSAKFRKIKNQKISHDLETVGRSMASFPQERGKIFIIEFSKSLMWEFLGSDFFKKKSLQTQVKYIYSMIKVADLTAGYKLHQEFLDYHKKLKRQKNERKKLKEQ